VTDNKLITDYIEFLVNSTFLNQTSQIREKFFMFCLRFLDQKELSSDLDETLNYKV